MTRRVALGLLAVLLVVSPMAGLVAADAGNSAAALQATNESNWTAPGSFRHRGTSNWRHQTE